MKMLEEFERLNHKLPFKRLCLDFAYKMTEKLRGHFGYKNLRRIQNQDNSSSSYVVLTSAEQLNDEEKQDDEWNLVPSDARRTHTIPASTMVVNTEIGIPLRIVLCPGTICT